MSESGADLHARNLVVVTDDEVKVLIEKEDAHDFGNVMFGTLLHAAEIMEEENDIFPLVYSLTAIVMFMTPITAVFGSKDKGAAIVGQIVSDLFSQVKNELGKIKNGRAISLPVLYALMASIIELIGSRKDLENMEKEVLNILMERIKEGESVN